MSKDHKKAIIDNLKILRQIEVENKQTFKAVAYAKVIKQLADMEGPVHSASDLDSLTGMGKSIKEKIELIIMHGHVEKTKDILDTGTAEGARYAAVEQLMAIMGIGPVKAKELVDVHGITSIDQLKQHTELLNEKQSLGLHYHEHFMRRIPRSEIDKHYGYVSAAFDKIDKDLRFEFAGSYRRGKKDSGDIDVLVTYKGNDAKKGEGSFGLVVEELKRTGYLVDDFAFGEKKYNGVCKLPRHKFNRRIDIMYTEPARFPFALLYFTGSQEFNIAMRNHALHGLDGKSFSLNEYGLKLAGAKKDDTISHKFNTEQDIFKFLKIGYVEPTEREQFKGFERT